MTQRPTTVDHDRPDVVIFLADDMGYSDLGCYGGEIDTPALDALAASGVRMSQFYNTARCSPSRASLLTGLHPHQTGIGILTHDDGPQGYPGDLNDRCTTIAEVARGAGYGTYLSGKWHVAHDLSRPNHAWPRQRGFDHWFGVQGGAASYWDPQRLWDDDEPITEFPDDFYLTDEIGRRAVGFVERHHRERAEDPMLLHVTFTAPHWPLHAPEEVVAPYRERYRRGWDALRAERHQRLIDSGLLDQQWPDSGRDAAVPAWDETGDQEWQAERMAVYAAQVTLLDRAVGEVVEALRRTGRLENTMIIMLSDNGGCAEEFPPGWTDELPGRHGHIPSATAAGERIRFGNSPDNVPGGRTTYASYGRPWANLSTTPFRLFKHWAHEGGIATPLIVRWPGVLPEGAVDHQPGQLPDIMATVLDATGAAYPDARDGVAIPPCEGTSLLPGWRGEPVPERELYVEHEGNQAIRRGRWKLTREHGGPWELYDLGVDRAETHDLAAEQPERVEALAASWQRWADRCGVLDRDQVEQVTPTKAHSNHHYASARPPGDGWIEAADGRPLVEEEAMTRSR